jgi:AcrR family transcriptional regulator
MLKNVVGGVAGEACRYGDGVPATRPRRGRPPSGGREEILRATLELIRERGMARVTTRAVAERAGVAEGSVFYHYKDRFGLLKAVFEQTLTPLELHDLDADPPRELAEVIVQVSEGIEAFLTNSLDVMMAAQSDAELRDALHAYMSASDYGPHRGIAYVGAYLAGQQEVGTIRADVSPTVIASLIVNDAFQRASLPKLVGHRQGIQGRREFVETLMALLAPPA